MKSKLMLTNHLVQKISWGKALERNFTQGIWAGEWENVEKILEVKRGGLSKDIDLSRKKKKKEQGIGKCMVIEG